jgi:hypothetical protein
MTKSGAAFLLTCVSCLLMLAPAALAAPANDDFAAAIVLAGDGESRGANNFGAGKETGEPGHAGDQGGASLWYRWTAPRSGWVVVDACDTLFDTTLAVYTGDAVGALSPVASSHGSPACASGPWLRFDADAGTTYRIAVDGFSGDGEVAEGFFSLRLAPLSFRPQNDFFAAASPLQRNSVGYYHATFHTTTDGASREAGEPLHAGNPGGNSVWFAWTSPSAERTQIQVCAPASEEPRLPFLSLLAVYTGSQVDRLAPVASASQNARVYAGNLCPSAVGSEVAFDPVAGTEYRIAVDGVNGTRGGFWIQLWQTPPRIKATTTTSIRRKQVRIAGRTASFGFGSNYADATFECRIDRRPFAPCASGKAYGHLRTGLHLFEVRALTALEGPDPTPARFGKFRIRAPRR